MEPWHPRWNSEICSVCKDLNIVDDIKIKRAGHITRMEEERIARKFRNGKFHNTRTVGKPGTQWEDVVQRDELQILGIREWRRRAADREEWSRLLREARAQKGL